MDLIIFVCHGNICRSPMAEFIAKHLDKDNKYQYLSRAVTYEEYANDMHHAAKYMLSKHDIPFKTHFAHHFAEVHPWHRGLFLQGRDKTIRTLFPARFHPWPIGWNELPRRCGSLLHICQKDRQPRRLRRRMVALSRQNPPILRRTEITRKPPHNRRN